MRHFLGEMSVSPDGMVEVRDPEGVPLLRAHPLEDDGPVVLIELAEIYELSKAGLTREWTTAAVPGLHEHNWESRGTIVQDLVGRDWRVCDRVYDKSRDFGDTYLLSLERWV